MKFKYYFDVFSNICKMFNYGGCDGNVNIFEMEIFVNIFVNSIVCKIISVLNCNFNEVWFNLCNEFF